MVWILVVGDLRVIILCSKLISLVDGELLNFIWVHISRHKKVNVLPLQKSTLVQQDWWILIFSPRPLNIFELQDFRLVRRKQQF